MNCSEESLTSDLELRSLPLLISKKKKPPKKPRTYFGIHAAGILKQGPTQSALVDAESFSNARQVPDGLHGDLGDVQLAQGIQTDFSVGDESAATDAFLELGKLHVSPCDGDGRAEIHYRRGI